ncbi:MAG TPA: TfoX/Sxy family protein [Burkholderiales bacterium]|nr:TfoX/Sxy family protein [Burkholderiales bacterium]
MSAEFVQHITGLLASLGRLNTRPMFGGHGLYSDGVFFGGDVLYLKADDTTRPRFLGAGLKPFVWRKRASVNYYRAPPEALESPDAGTRCCWSRRATPSRCPTRAARPASARNSSRASGATCGARSATRT